MSPRTSSRTSRKRSTKSSRKQAHVSLLDDKKKKKRRTKKKGFPFPAHTPPSFLHVSCSIYPAPWWDAQHVALLSSQGFPRKRDFFSWVMNSKTSRLRCTWLLFCSRGLCFCRFEGQTEGMWYACTCVYILCGYTGNYTCRRGPALFKQFRRWSSSF